MKLVFFGTSEFAVPSLQALADSVCLVVSQPDRPSGRGMHFRPSPVKIAAQELGVEVETPERCKDPAFVERIRSIGADALVVAAYGQILPVALLEASERGAINLHGSILPAYRGAAPIQRAILSGERETGVTLMQMDKGMDTGDAIAIERTPIGPDETYSELLARLAAIAAEMAATWMPRIARGDYPRAPQDDTLATYAPMVAKAEAELSFARSASAEYARFRAFTEAPGAFVVTRFGNLKVRRARWSGLSGAPGEVIAVSPELTAGFSEGSMEWVEVQPAGKKAVSGRDLANGWRLKPGDRLIDSTRFP